MKKRILSLLVALCLIVGLLPVVALAGTTTDTLQAYVMFCDNANNAYTLTNNGEVKYLKIKADAGQNGQSVLETGAENDYQVKLLFPSGSDTLEIYLNGGTITSKTTTADECVLIGSDSVNNFNAKIIVEQSTTMELQSAAAGGSYHGCIVSQLAEGKTTTITSSSNSAQLTLTMKSSKNRMRGIHSTNAVELQSANINIDFSSYSGSYPRAGIQVADDLTIDGGTLSVNVKDRAIFLSDLIVDSGHSTFRPSAGNYTLTIRNNANVTLTGGLGNSAVSIDGEFNIDRSTVTIINTASSNYFRIFDSVTGGNGALDNSVNVQNATVQMSTDTNGSDPYDFDPSQVENYGYPTTRVIIVDDSTDEPITETRYNKYFHTTPVSGGGSGGDSGSEPEVFTNMQLDDNLGFNFFVKAEDVADATDLHATIVHNGVSTTNIQATDYTEGTTAYKMFSYNGLTAKQMMETLTITIYDGEDVLVEEYEDSVYTYINRMSQDTSLEEKWLKLFAATLNYGAAAQEQFGYNTSNKPSIPDTLTAANELVQAIAAPDGTHVVGSNNYVGMSLQWDYTIALAMFFDGLEDGMTAKFTVGGGSEIPVNTITTITQEGTTYKGFYLPEAHINYDDAAKEIVVTVLNADGTEYATATDSMESYLTRKNSANNLAFWRFAECCNESF